DLPPGEDVAREMLADDGTARASDDILLVEIPAANERDPERLEVPRRYGEARHFHLIVRRVLEPRRIEEPRRQATVDERHNERLRDGLPTGHSGEETVECRHRRLEQRVVMRRAADVELHDEQRLRMAPADRFSEMPNGCATTPRATH